MIQAQVALGDVNEDHRQAITAGRPLIPADEQITNRAEETERANDVTLCAVSVSRGEKFLDVSPATAGERFRVSNADEFLDETQGGSQSRTEREDRAQRQIRLAALDAMQSAPAESYAKARHSLDDILEPPFEGLAALPDVIPDETPDDLLMSRHSVLPPLPHFTSTVLGGGPQPPPKRSLHQ